MGATFSERPLRIGVVGLTHGHVEWLLGAAREREDLKIVGVWEPDRALFDRLAHKHGVARTLWSDDLGAMLDTVEPEAASVMTSTLGHLDAARACLPRSVPCLFEKPLAVSAEAARTIADLARAHDTLALTNYETSWYASLRRAKELLETREMGPLRRVTFEHGHQGPREVGCYDEFLAWLTDPEGNGGPLGGGAIMDFGCYGVCLATWFMDGRVPDRVVATTACSRPETYPGVDTDSTIAMAYERQQGDVGDCAPVTFVAQGSWDWPDHRKTATFICERGEIEAGMGTNLRVRCAHGEWASETAERVDAARADCLNDMWTYFRMAVRGECPIDPMSSVPVNVTVCDVLDRARRSAAEG